MMTSDSNTQPPAAGGGGSTRTSTSSNAKPRTFYRRILKPPCIAFSSNDGRKFFREALKEGTMECYFPLAEQFRTQDEPAFCGLSTLTMVLNALAVDPGRVWKGPWRWYHESMLDCCAPLDVVKAKGITMPTMGCLARCNGLSVEMSGPDTHSVEDFRAVVEDCAKKDHGKVLVVSYDRSGVNQTGTGHFSPVGGFHRAADSVLIMDTARFKHPPHWVPLPKLWEAMKTPDPETGRPRGFMLLEKAHKPSPHRLFTANSANYKDWPKIASWVNEVIESANGAQADEGGKDGAGGGGGGGSRELRNAKTMAEFVPALIEMLPPVVKGFLTTLSAPEQAAPGEVQDGLVLQVIQGTEVYREVTILERFGRASRSPSVGGGGSGGGTSSKDGGDGGGREPNATVCSGGVPAQPNQSQSQAGSRPSPSGGGPSPTLSLVSTMPLSPTSPAQPGESNGGGGCACSSRHVLSVITYALLLLLHERDKAGPCAEGLRGGGGGGGGSGAPEPLWRRDPLGLLPASVADEAQHVAGMLRGLIEMEGRVVGSGVGSA